MKKAILLFSMVIFVAGILFIKDADADTVLIKRESMEAGMDDMTQSTEEFPDTGNETGRETVMTAETVDVSEEDTAVLATPDMVNSFAFLRLDMEEQQIYMEILSSLLKYENETTLSTMNTAGIDKAFQCVMLDHPEIFYVDGYKYTEYKNGDHLEKITFSGNYLYDQNEMEKRKEEIEVVTDAILKEAPDTDDEYEKVKYIYDTIISRTEYDFAAEDHQNICSVFLSGRSVCQGYAKSIQYLLLKMGIEAQLVTGTVRDGDGHAWNLVSVNGEWYHLDATWGDAYYMFGTESEDVQIAGGNVVNYDYFCVTTEQIEKTHVMDMPIELPLCKVLTDNFYVREGLYFEEYDEVRIADLFRQAMEKEQETITVKCENSVVYETLYSELIVNQKIFDMVPTEDVTIAYTDNPQQKSITFWL